MSTLSPLQSEKCMLTTTRDEYNYQLMAISNKKDSITRQIGDHNAEHADDEDYDIDADWELKQLEVQDKLYDSKKGTLETQLKGKNDEIANVDKAIDTQTKEVTAKISGS